MFDDNTCTHEVGCLKGLAVQLPGAAGLMIALVSVETVLLVLLVVLVAGPLRSHAEILRRLGPGDRRAAIAPGPRPCRPGAARPGPGDDPVPARRRTGDPVSLSFEGAGSAPTLLAFLTSGCSTCAGFWESLGEPRLPPACRR